MTRPGRSVPAGGLRFRGATVRTWTRGSAPTFRLRRARAQAYFSRFIVGGTASPHLSYFNSAAHGYVILEAAHSGMPCTMKAARTSRSTETDLLTLRVFGVPEGRVRLTTIDAGTREIGNTAR
jgi:hypothetical protein